MVSLDQFRGTYLTECTELLADMEERLVALTPETADSESLNAIFRCADSIKGGSGAFGLDAITHFTHVLEALLDAMREGKVPPTREAVDMLLKSVDIVTQMVEAAKQGIQPPEDLGADLLVSLKQLAGGTPAGGDAKAPVSEQTSPGPDGQKHFWQICFAPHEALFSTGNEPLLILRELSKLGKRTSPPIPIVYQRWSRSIPNPVISAGRYGWKP